MFSQACYAPWLARNSGSRSPKGTQRALQLGQGCHILWRLRQANAPQQTLSWLDSRMAMTIRGIAQAVPLTCKSTKTGRERLATVDMKPPAPRSPIGRKGTRWVLSPFCSPPPSLFLRHCPTPPNLGLPGTELTVCAKLSCCFSS